MLDADLGRIILTLTDAAQADAPFSALLGTVAQALRADDGALFLADTEWRLTQARPSPLPDGLRQARRDRVYSGDDWPLRDWPLPARGDGRALGLSVADGVAWVVLTRQRGPLRAIDTARLSALAPHLAQALALALRLTEQRAAQADQALALRRLSVGLLHLDRTRSPLPQPDGTARALLAAQGLSLGDLAGLWPKTDTECLTPVAPDLDLLTRPATDRPGQLGLLRPRRGSLPPPARIATALGLTLGEARLAHALALGDSLDTCARQLGLTEATARFYSKQIFAKTGEPGQPALMRRIWASALQLLR